MNSSTSPNSSFASGDAVDLVPEHPGSNFPGAFAAFAVGIHRFQKPYAAFKPECLVGERSNRANIDHISGKFVGYHIPDKGTDLGNISTVKHAVQPFVGKLIRNINTPVAKDAPVHVELDVFANIDHREFPSFLFGEQCPPSRSRNSDPEGRTHLPGRTPGNRADG